MTDSSPSADRPAGGRGLPEARTAPRGRDRLRLRRAVRHEGAQERRRRRDDDREDDPSPVPAAALPGGDRHPVPGRDRPADARDPRGPEERPGHPRRGQEHRPRPAPGHLAGARPDHHHAVRLAPRGGRRGAVLLRQRPLRRARARHEEHRRRPRAARPDLRRVRARRAGRDRGGDRAAPHLRRRRRRPDRRRDGGADRRARAPHAPQGLPQHQLPRGAGDPPRRGRPGAAAVRGQARCRHPEVAREARRRGAARRDGHRPRRVRHHRADQGRARGAHRVGHEGLGGGRAGQPARQAARRAVGRSARPRRPHRGQPRPDAARLPRGLRGGRHDRAGQPPRGCAGRDPGLEVRREGDPADASRASRRRSRSSTSTRAAWPPSPASARSRCCPDR